jgi:hypothetical protein
MGIVKLTTWFIYEILHSLCYRLYLAPQLLVHAGDGPDQQLVAIVQRHLSVGHRLAEPRQVVLGAEEVAQVQQQLEVRQLVGEGPAFLAHPAMLTATTQLRRAAHQVRN